MELSKEQKRKMIHVYKMKNQKNFYLKKKEAVKLFQYLEEMLENSECDHTLKNTNRWLKENIADEERCECIRQEMKESGGFCDCEVLDNCYEEYDIL